MNKQNYTSLEFSKKLKGCNLESDWYWIKPFKTQEWELVNKSDWSLNNHHEFYPTYDILNDICIKYAKEFFGICKEYKDDGFNTPYYQSARWVLHFLQQNKKQEAEKYIWEHCKFNPKNK